MSYTLPSAIPWEEIGNGRHENPTPVPHTAARFARWDYFYDLELGVFTHLSPVPPSACRRGRRGASKSWDAIQYNEKCPPVWSIAKNYRN